MARTTEERYLGIDTHLGRHTFKYVSRDQHTLTITTSNSNLNRLLRTNPAITGYLADQGTGTEAAVEFHGQHQVPAIAAGAGRAGQAEDECIFRLTGEGAVVSAAALFVDFLTTLEGGTSAAIATPDVPE